MAKRNSYRVVTKLRDIRAYDAHKSIRKVAKMFKVTRKTLREWIASRENLECSPNKISRSRVVQRRCEYRALENDLFEWIQEMRRNGACVQGYQIQEQALSLATMLEISNFHASRGWLYRFLLRKDFRFDAFLLLVVTCQRISKMLYRILFVISHQNQNKDIYE